MDEDKKIAIPWLVRGLPWKNCPFHLQMMIITSGGHDKAIELFKRFYKNDAVDITECIVIDVMREEDMDIIEREVGATA